MAVWVGKTINNWIKKKIGNRFFSNHLIFLFSILFIFIIWGAINAF